MIAIASNLFQVQLLIVLTKALCVRSDATEWLKKVAYLAAKQPRRARNYGSSILRKSALKNWLCNRVPGILDQQFLRQSFSSFFKQDKRIITAIRLFSGTRVAVFNQNWSVLSKNGPCTELHSHIAWGPQALLLKRSDKANNDRRET